MGQRRRARTWLARAASVVVLAVVGCGGGANKQDIPLTGGQTYDLKSTGTVRVYPSAGIDGEKGAQPLHRLRVKIRNNDAAAKPPDAWHCSDCICNADECTCTECTQG